MTYLLPESEIRACSNWLLLAALKHFFALSGRRVVVNGMVPD